MKWEYLNTKSNTGEYNMSYDMNLAETTEPGTAVLRFYKWKPYCISFGANQDFNTINIMIQPFYCSILIRFLLSYIVSSCNLTKSW